MTQQYVAGELSLLLAQLWAVATTESAGREIAGLRREAETMPTSALGSVVVRAMTLVDQMCWESLELGDSGAFSCQAKAAAQLHEFGVCANLLGGWTHDHST
ncbi:hypothetical protein [Kribbella sancticallisti]